MCHQNKATNSSETQILNTVHRQVLLKRLNKQTQLGEEKLISDSMKTHLEQPKMKETFSFFLIQAHFATSKVY